MRKHRIASAVIVASLLTTQTSYGFTFLYGPKMRVNENTAIFHVDIPGSAPSGVSWNEAFDEAAREWRNHTLVNIVPLRQKATPCNDQDMRLPAVGFSDQCYLFNRPDRPGIAFAIPTVSVDLDVLYESQIVYDSNRIWDVYDGKHRQEFELGTGAYNIYDFRRTTLHEIGHALGLGHGVFPKSMLTGTTRDKDIYELNADDICGVAIGNGRPDMCPLLLPNPATMSGSETSAIFVGGASNDRGATYRNVFARTDIIDVMSTVVVEDDHYGLPGRLHVVIELSNGTTLTKIDEGFYPWDGTVEALQTSSVVTLSGANELHILKDFNLQANLIQDIGVAIYVGYSLEEEPEEVYFSGYPIQFRVE